MKTHVRHIVSTEFRARLIARTAKVSAMLSAVLLTLLPALVGCTREPFGEGPDAPDSGSRTEVMIQLDAAVPENEIRSRADAFDNTAVGQLWVGVYDITTGNRVGSAHFTSPTSPVTLPVLYYDQHPTVVIVGVANYTNWKDWDGNDLRGQLDAADTWNKFVDLNVRPALVGGAPVVNPDQQQIMMGVLTGDTQRAFFKKSDDGRVCIVTSDNTSGTINPNDESSSFRVKLTGDKIYGSMIHSIEGKKIQLQRLFAQVNVTVKSGDNNISVTNVSYRRGNMPLAVYLAERPTWTGNVKNWSDKEDGTIGYVDHTPNFADTKMTVQDGKVSDASQSYQTDSENAWIAGNRDNTFSFAHYENKHWGVNTSSAHNDREAAPAERQGLGHEYNSFASYFVVRMSVLDTKNNQSRSAIVEYVIHEGNINGEYGDERGQNNHQDYCAFRNMIYNYTITVNGINDIVNNVNTNNHHNGQSGTIWEADMISVNNFSANFTIDGPSLGKSANPNFIVRFYVGQGPDKDPLDYISLPEGIKIEDLKGIYWPTIDSHTIYDNPPYGFNYFDIKKINNPGDIPADIFGNNVREWGGEYSVKFNPPTTASQFDPDAWRMGIYYYNPDEKGSLDEKVDPLDGCSKFENKIVHIVEWKPAQRQAENLVVTGTARQTSNVQKFIDTGVDLSLSDIRVRTNYAWGSLADSNGYQLYIEVNGKSELLDQTQKSYFIPMSEFNGNTVSYRIYAKATDTRQYKDSTQDVNGSISLSDPAWDFSSDTFSNWYASNFSSGDRYTAPEDIEKLWNGIYICVLNGKQIGWTESKPNYLYFNNTGNGNGIKFRVYKTCHVKITAYANKPTDNQEKKMTIKGGNPEIWSISTFDTDTDFTTEIIVNPNTGYQDVSIYYSNGGGGYIHSISLTD